MLSSFSLGNLEHITSLVKKYEIHLLIFKIIRFNKTYFEQQQQKNGQKNHQKLLESCLLCLSNLYSSSQLLPKLIYTLDKQLYYVKTTNKNETTNLNSLVYFLNLSQRTKQTVLNIFTISSTNLMSTSCFDLKKETSNFRKFRSILIKSDLIKHFSDFLTSLNTKLQLSCLKFYASISFECVESTRLILSTIFYDYSLIDLIGAYLSRENQNELQLYAAKCLTNLYRSSLLIENEINSGSSSGGGGGGEEDMNMNLKLLNSNSHLIKSRTLPTLVRLCVRFSVKYKHTYINMGGGGLVDTPENLYTYNILYLIESVSTLTYLIELNSDLQQIAGYLEQIIPTLIQNILYSFSNILTLYKKKLRNTLTGDLFFGNQSNQTSSNLTTERHHSHDVAGSTKNIQKTSNSSLFSLFYLVYNQFTTKGIHLKQSQHQYNQTLKSLNKISLFSSSSSSVDQFLKMFDLNVYKYLMSVSLHLMASLASNNEESRRLLTDNSDLINKVVELIQLKNKKKNNLSSSLSSSQDEDYNDDAINIDEIRLNQFLENDDCNFDDLLIEFEDFEEDSLKNLSKELKQQSSDPNLLRLSSLCLLHSLSRSVHQLRTKFLDNKLWSTIIELINKIYAKKLRINELNEVRLKVLAAKIAPSEKKIIRNQSSNDEDDEEQMSSDILQNEMPITDDANTTTTSTAQININFNDEDEIELIDFNLNEKNLIAILFALVANLVIDFSPCKEVSFFNYNQSKMSIKKNHESWSRIDKIQFSYFKIDKRSDLNGSDFSSKSLNKKLKLRFSFEINLLA